MAAFLNAYARQASRMPAGISTPVAMRPVAHFASHLTRPKLIMQWRVGPDGRLSLTWLSEEAAAFGNPHD